MQTVQTKSNITIVVDFDAGPKESLDFSQY